MKLKFYGTLSNLKVWRTLLLRHKLKCKKLEINPEIISEDKNFFMASVTKKQDELVNELWESGEWNRSISVQEIISPAKRKKLIQKIQFREIRAFSDEVVFGEAARREARKHITDRT